MNFNEKLILNKYILSLFGVESLENLTDSFKQDNRYESIDDEGVSLFYYAITSNMFGDSKLDKLKLLEYDNNIVKHTKSLKQDIKWKYFQYMTLLFTEIYLDMYCSSKETLLKNLNEFLVTFNESLGKKNKKESIDSFELGSLNKLAFWNATGSGKTLLMHINLLQFNYYNKSKINKTILITPNGGLSSQHLKEFEANGLAAEMFSEDSKGLFQEDIIEVLEISKLKEEKGDTTFAVDSFGDNNLVFVDEGHRGAKGEEWKTNRDALSVNGFAFEYSATYGQAIASATPKKKKDELIQEYSKSILFDYSYKYFHSDGFGKDFTILNLQDEPKDDLKYNYLVGSLLSFYQQKKIFKDNPTKMNEYNIENPLMVFVGAKVSKSLSKEEGSDITKILKFLEQFITQKEVTITTIKNILEHKSGISTSSGIDIFTGKFSYLSSVNIDANSIYDDILNEIFNSSSSGVLHIEELRGCEGEIGLKIGESDYFGVVNIGDVSNFKKLCVSINLNISSKEFSKSLFLNINEKKSNINILIGSKKFTEGWSSWRVSTMGLLNMGQSEGSQVIQLFGRGVRLKGKDMSLKRSTHYGKGLEHKYLSSERLNIFGLKANYMEQFRKYLEDEGVQSSEMFDIALPVIKDDRYKNKNLKVLRLKDGKKYKDNETIDFKYIQTNTTIINKVIVNLYAKAQVIGIIASSNFATKPDTYKFKESDLVFIDKDKLFLELQSFKNEKKYFNLNIEKSSIDNFIRDDQWYLLEVPKGYFNINKFEDFVKIQDTFTVLMKKYLEQFYIYHKNDYEKEYMEYRELKENDKNFVDEYNISCELNEDNNELIEKLKNLEEMFSQRGTTSTIDLGYFKSFHSSSHLYNPLLFKDEKQKQIKISPIELNKGEIEFVEDLELYLKKNAEIYNDCEIFLLRNKSKVGIGFFEDGGFYPDFIMWILKDDKQYITFIDPKGIRNLNPKNDPKINFFNSIKTKEYYLNDSNTVLNSFIISNTPFSVVSNLHSDIVKEELEAKNLFFQEDKSSYIGKIFHKIFEAYEFDSKLKEIKRPEKKLDYEELVNKVLAIASDSDNNIFDYLDIKNIVQDTSFSNSTEHSISYLLHLNHLLALPNNQYIFTKYFTKDIDKISLVYMLDSTKCGFKITDINQQIKQLFLDHTEITTDSLKRKCARVDSVVRWNENEYFIHKKHIEKILYSYNFQNLITFIDNQLESIKSVHIEDFYKKEKDTLDSYNIISKEALFSLLELKYPQKYKYISSSQSVAKVDSDINSKIDLLLSKMQENKTYTLEELSKSMHNNYGTIKSIVARTSKIVIVKKESYKRLDHLVHPTFQDEFDKIILEIVEHLNNNIERLLFVYPAYLYKRYREKLHNSIHHYNSFKYLVLDILRKAENTKFQVIQNNRIVSKSYLDNNDLRNSIKNRLNYHSLIKDNLFVNNTEVNYKEINDFFEPRGFRYSKLFREYLSIDDERRQIARVDASKFILISSLNIDKKNIENISSAVKVLVESGVSNVEEILQKVSSDVLPTLANGHKWNNYLLHDILNSEFKKVDSIPIDLSLR